MATRGRPRKKSVDEKITMAYLKKENERLKGLISRQDDAVDQSLDTVAELTHEVEFYRKQVNHLLALLNILAKGA